MGRHDGWRQTRDADPDQRSGTLWHAMARLVPSCASTRGPRPTSGSPLQNLGRTVTSLVCPLTNMCFSGRRIQRMGFTSLKLLRLTLVGKSLENSWGPKQLCSASETQSSSLGEGEAWQSERRLAWANLKCSGTRASPRRLPWLTSTVKPRIQAPNSVTCLALPTRRLTRAQDVELFLFIQH